MELIGIFITAILLLLAGPAAYAGVIGAPTALADKEQVKKALQRACVGKNDVFYELGTGSGRIMLAAAQRGARVVGFELSPIFYLTTIINLRRRGINDYQLYCKNFFNAPIGNASVVYCFLMPQAMTKLKEKFARELRPGTKVISYAFEIPGWTPSASVASKNKQPVYIYTISSTKEPFSLASGTIPVSFIFSKNNRQ